MESTHANKRRRAKGRSGPRKAAPSLDELQYNFVMTKDHINIGEVKDCKSLVAVFKKAYEEAKRRAKDLA